MASTDEQEGMRPASRQEIKKLQGRLALRLLSGLLGALLSFDLLSVFAPGFMGREIYPGAVYSVGVTFGFLIIAAVVLCAAYYVYRLNKAYERHERKSRAP